MITESHSGLLLTIGIGGHDKLFQSCVESHRAYAERNEFCHVIVNEAPRKLEGCEASWLKLWLISMALTQGYDWIAYVDADCEIRAHTPLIRDEPAFRDPSRSVFLAPGRSGRYNAGVIFVRNTPSSREFFQTVMAHADLPVPRRDRAPYENGHIIHYANRSAIVGALEHRQWNNNSVLDPHSFIQHYSTGPLRTVYFTQIGHHTAPLSWGKRLLRKLRRLTSDPNGRIRERISTLTGYYRTRYPASFGSLPTSGQSGASLS